MKYGEQEGIGCRKHNRFKGSYDFLGASFSFLKVKIASTKIFLEIEKE